MRREAPGGKMAKVTGGSDNRGVVIGFDHRGTASLGRLPDSNQHYDEGDFCN